MHARLPQGRQLRLHSVQHDRRHHQQLRPLDEHSLRHQQPPGWRRCQHCEPQVGQPRRLRPTGADVLHLCPGRGHQPARQRLHRQLRRGLRQEQRLLFWGLQQRTVHAVCWTCHLCLTSSLCNHACCTATGAVLMEPPPPPPLMGDWALSFSKNHPSNTCRGSLYYNNTLDFHV